VTVDASAAAFAGLHQTTDADLLAAAVRKDANAFGRIVAKYHGLVYRVVWRTTDGSAEAEDIAQDVFLKLWNNPAQLREAGALKGWLLRVAHNMAMDCFRRGPLKKTAEVPEMQDGRPTAEEGMSRDWVSRRMDLTLARFEMLPQAEAAEIMEISVDAFESLLARSRRALKEELKSDGMDMLSALRDEG
jgi:RNA polymerase sigma-70 factor, ECF subfamily